MIVDDGGDGDVMLKIDNDLVFKLERVRTAVLGPMHGFRKDKIGEVKVRSFVSSDFYFPIKFIRSIYFFIRFFRWPDSCESTIFFCQTCF